MKKAAMKLSSLPLKMSVSYRNRTYNRVLGEPPIGKNHVPSKAIKARFYKEIHAFKPKLIPALKS